MYGERKALEGTRATEHLVVQQRGVKAEVNVESCLKMFEQQLLFSARTLQQRSLSQYNSLSLHRIKFSNSFVFFFIFKSPSGHDHLQNNKLSIISACTPCMGRTESFCHFRGLKPILCYESVQAVLGLQSSSRRPRTLPVRETSFYGLINFFSHVNCIHCS